MPWRSKLWNLTGDPRSGWAVVATGVSEEERASMLKPSGWHCCVAESCGTALLVFLGCGAVHVAVLTGELVGLWQVGIVWGLAIMLAIAITGPVSGAHLNPAITLALALTGRFDRKLVPSYLVAQFAGAIAAAAVLFTLFGPLLDEREKQLGVARGGPGSELTAMCYGEYYPNPGLMQRMAGRYDPSLADRHYRLVSTPVAFLAEFLGTALLGAVILAVTAAGRNDPSSRLAPVLIGLTVTALIAVLAPLTQACFNPARDLGPRLFAALAGWGSQALPGPRGWEMLLVYAVAPVLGALCGMQFYARWFEAHAASNPPPGN